MPEINYNVMIVVLAFILIDILSGIAKAVATKSLSSQIMREGIIHKATYIIVMLLAVACDFGMAYMDLGFTVGLFTPVCALICLTEAVSILENVGEANPDLKDSGLLSIFKDRKE